MKVLFLYISTNMCRDGTLWYFDEGVASVVSCLRAAGHGAAFRMVGEDDDFYDMLSWVREHEEERTLLVFHTSLLFSAFGHDRPETYPIVAGLKEATGFPSAFIGLYATVNPELVIEYPGVNYIGRGEMDEALAELCDALDAGRPVRDIRNFWVKENGSVYRNDLRPLVKDISKLPFPARDLIPRERQANERDGILTLVGVRGCPRDCNFCSNHVLNRLYRGKGPYVRIKPVDYVIKEIHAARAADPEIRAVFFHDDIFGISGEWIREFFERYPREVGLPFGCNLIMSQVEAGFARALRRSGCCQVQIGVESGCEYLRNEILKKNIDEEAILETVRIFQTEGIYVKFYAMMGVPGETRKRYRESVKNFARFNSDMIQIQVWEAHEGSDLLAADPNAGHLAQRHYQPGEDRRARRLKFYFRFFHRYVALFQILREVSAGKPIAASLLRGLVSLSILFPQAPDLLMSRDWDGRPMFPGRLFAASWLRKLASLTAGRFIKKVLERERKLAADYIWPDDVEGRPSDDGWEGAMRIDGRRGAVSGR